MGDQFFRIRIIGFVKEKTNKHSIKAARKYDVKSGEQRDEQGKLSEKIHRRKIGKREILDKHNSKRNCGTEEIYR
jgi:hypothetical protein